MGSKVAAKKRHNAPVGWAAFRAFRQEPAPIVRKQHGNRKHGRYSKTSTAGMRVLRLCTRILNGRHPNVPPPDFILPVPPGWAV
jgi:hypothetical protein